MDGWMDGATCQMVKRVNCWVDEWDEGYLLDKKLQLFLGLIN
jgi:hypothetical protein